MTHALPIPASARPLSYTLALLVYDRVSGQPLASRPASRQGSIVELGQLAVQPASAPPESPDPLATFDYLDLLTVKIPLSITAPGAALPVDLVWQPRPSPYRDTYLAVLRLRDKSGTVRQEWERFLGGWDYPSGQWPASLPVLDQPVLATQAELATGRYTLTLQVIRADDRQTIPARDGWRQGARDEVALGTVAIDPATLR